MHVILLGRDSVHGQPTSGPSSQGQCVISPSPSFSRRYKVFCYLLTLTSRGTACGCPRGLWEITEPPRSPTQRSIEEAKSPHTGTRGPKTSSRATLSAEKDGFRKTFSRKTNLRPFALRSEDLMYQRDRQCNELVVRNQPLAHLTNTVLLFVNARLKRPSCKRSQGIGLNAYTLSTNPARLDWRSML